MAGAAGKAFCMAEDTDNTMSREERLAAKLRENLRRRKAQSRQLHGEKAADPTLPKGDSDS